MGVAKRERTLYARALMFGGYFRYRHIERVCISAIGPKGLIPVRLLHVLLSDHQVGERV